MKNTTLGRRVQTYGREEVCVRKLQRECINPLTDVTEADEKTTVTVGGWC